MNDSAGSHVAAELAAAFQLSSDGMATGYAADPRQPAVRLVVEILADGLPVALLRADRFNDACARLGIGDACHGFTVRIADAVLARARRLEARLANTATLVGAIEGTGRGLPRARLDRPIGHARWDSGLRIRGWLEAGTTEEAPEIVGRVDGAVVARAFATGWGFGEELSRSRPLRTFTLDLPRSFADGRVHAVDISIDGGHPVPGSPCLVFAVEDGLADLVDRFAEVESERPRARLIDDLWPQTVPFSELEQWLRRFPLPPKDVPRQTRICIVVVGEDGLGRTIDSLDRQPGFEISVAVLPAGASPVEFDGAKLAAAFDAEPADCGLFVLTPAGTRFEPHALAHLHAAALVDPRPAAVYCDVLVEGRDGRWPVAFPSYDDELSLEQGIGALCFALTRPVMARGLGGDESLYGVFARACDASLPDLAEPVHVPALLATLPALPARRLEPALRRAGEARLAARGVEADVVPNTSAAAAAVRVRRRVAPGRTSVVIASIGASADAVSLSHAAFAVFECDIVVADAGASGPAMADLLERCRALGCTVVRRPGSPSLPRLLNAAAAEATGETLLFIAAGAVPVDADWDAEMRGRLQGGDVGAVGGLMHASAGPVRHAGFVLGPRRGIAARFTDRRVGEPGYAGYLQAAHGCSAISAACMMTPRRRFAELGGFDAEHLSQRHADVDYCLRLAEIGQRTIFTPHARFLYDEAETVRPEDTDLKDLDDRERALLRDRWTLAPGCDPFYGSWLAMDRVPYSGLSWPPGTREPRSTHRPMARFLQPGF